MDTERLYSLASQVFEGVSERISQTIKDEKATTHRPRRTSEGDIEKEVAEASLRTENTILLDHLYYQLEERISGAIVDIATAESVDYEKIQRNGTFIRVKGVASIDDYNRMSSFLDEFNDFGVSLAYVGSSHTGEIEQLRANLEAEKEHLKSQIHSSKSPLAKSQLKQQLANLEDTSQPLNFLQAFAATKGLYRDPMLLHSIKTIAEAFRRGVFEINISQPYLETTASFRSVLDKRWLRSEPEYLRSLYTGASIGTNLVVIGQITAIPDESNFSKLMETSESETSDEPSLTDILNPMFRLMGALDEMIGASTQEKSVVVQPLAIYKEVVLPSV